jgi:hypothetical protein
MIAAEVRGRRAQARFWASVPSRTESQCTAGDTRMLPISTFTSHSRSQSLSHSLSLSLSLTLTFFLSLSPSRFQMVESLSFSAFGGEGE